MTQAAKVALLVGADDAIGAAVARRFARGRLHRLRRRRWSERSDRTEARLVSWEAASYMTARGRGTILFTGATASVKGRTGFAAFSSAKFGLRAVAQAMARELGPRNIHVVHLLIDAGVDSEAIHQRMKAAKGIDASEIPQDSLTKTISIAETCWFLHGQSRDGWTHELDLRPSVETW
jgi:NAD(P)-dependent dehydrogenase (short-subunit alcohol dehydrogenase family)